LNNDVATMKRPHEGLKTRPTAAAISISAMASMGRSVPKTPLWLSRGGTFSVFVSADSLAIIQHHRRHDERDYHLEPLSPSALGVRAASFSPTMRGMILVRPVQLPVFLYNQTPVLLIHPAVATPLFRGAVGFTSIFIKVSNLSALHE
jgi:hypothetical protein